MVRRQSVLQAVGGKHGTIVATYPTHRRHPDVRVGVLNEIANLRGRQPVGDIESLPPESADTVTRHHLHTRGMEGTDGEEVDQRG